MKKQKERVNQEKLQEEFGRYQEIRRETREKLEGLDTVEKALFLTKKLITLIEKEDREKAQEILSKLEEIKTAWELKKRGKKCEVCGKPFLPNPGGPEQKYCSATCRSRAYRERKRAMRKK